MVQVGTTVEDCCTYTGLSMWVLANPPTGANTFSVSTSGTGTLTSITANLVSYYGANQTTPMRAGTYQTYAGTTPSLTITSNAADLTTTAIADLYSIAGYSNQTEDGTTRDAIGNYDVGSDHATTPGATVTHTWRSGAGAFMAGFSIMAASTVTAPPRRKVIQ